MTVAETVPTVGDVVHVRHRQHLVEGVANDVAGSAVDLICLDDDAQGKRSRVLWDLELGARILRPQDTGLGPVAKLDEPRHFAAYLHALKWNCVTATDARLFQAPFRAGIKLLTHQLIPLRRALELPRVNLFVADDVGLGKTIEAGLVLQELSLRQRANRVLIICPASVVLQWRDEMEKRFGIHFEVFSRDFVARKRQERGFAVNPWATHTHFIVSYQMLRRPDVLEPLRQHLGERARKSILILDEAHNAAPASASKYAVDSRVTNMVRQLAPLFENRLFLSATPHNGHSNSFSSLLELLDPQRFTRGVAVQPEQRDAVMVRRLKGDLRALGYGEGCPTREIVRIELRHEAGHWLANGRDLGAAEPVELRLSELLAQYKSLVNPKRGELVFVNLQKRLLSSIEAFSRTLRVHRDALGKAQHAAIPEPPDEDEQGPTDEAQEELFAEATAAASSRVSVTEQARAKLNELADLAERNRAAPDAKVRALLAWIRENQLQDRKWNQRRVIVFTEFGDTKRYLLEQLTAALEETDRASERILQLHGGMSDASRSAVQTAFNGDPATYPVRILLATDAAREGVNLQGHCADLFHHDIPWNPARMEQRNGRIDRTLQDEEEVRCMYFFYPQRLEDDVLRTVVNKVERIKEELGSLGSVVMDRL